MPSRAAICLFQAVIRCVLVSSSIQFSLNPGCETSNVSNTERCADGAFENSVAYARIADGNCSEVLHVVIWLGGRGAVPSITVLRTKLDCQVGFKWKCLLEGTCGDNIMYTLSNDPDSVISSTTLVFPGIAYVHPDRLVSAEQVIQAWALSVSDGRATIASVPSPSRAITDQIRVNLTVRGWQARQIDHLSPHLPLTNESVIVDASMSGRHDEHYIGMQAGIIQQPQNELKPALSTIKVFNDELMPGVFKRLLLRMTERTEMSFMPLAFTSPQRANTQWVGWLPPPHGLNAMRMADYNNSAVHVPMCNVLSPANDQRTIFLVNYTYSLAVLDKLDPADKQLRHLTWTLTISPSHTYTAYWSKRTTFLAVFGFTTPIAAILTTELYQLAVHRRMLGFTNPWTTSAYQEIDQ